MNDIEIRISKFVESIKELTSGQMHWIDNLICQFKMPFDFKRTATSDLMPNHEILQDFGDTLRVHHAFSKEPFTKDKFEYALEKVCIMHNIDAQLSRKGNPGHDITINGLRASLKTEAAKGLQINKIHISKFMELGSGEWGTDVNDLIGLREQFFAHMNSYERIFTLRTLLKGPTWSYELVEIPKALLLEASSGKFEMGTKSKAVTARPGFCRVYDNLGELKFQLYFDGAGERKLQIQQLLKSNCTVHATWSFESVKQEQECTIPTETMTLFD